MILEARERGALDEVLVIASALSVQDVRDRPMDMQTQADQQHAKFDDEKSEFSGYLRLWKWIRAGTHGPAQGRRTGRAGRAHTSCPTASTSSCCARTSSTCGACANGATSTASCTPWWPSTSGA